ncbi:MAG: hypothetical protein QXT63_04180 [Thermoplasmata archaeon]
MIEPAKILISTFCRCEKASQIDDDRAIQKLRIARRELPYNRLIVLTNVPNDAKLKEIKEMDEKAGIKVDIITVDAYDFIECFKKVDETIASLLPLDNRKSIKSNGNKKGNEIKEKRHRIYDNIFVNISGGTKLLATATLIVCFNRGIKAYHCDSNGKKEIPLINLYEFMENIDKNDCKILQAAKEEIDYHELKKNSKLSQASFDKALRKLINCKWLKYEKKNGTIKYKATDLGLHYAMQFLK